MCHTGIPLLAAAFIKSHKYRLISLALTSTVALLAFGAIGAWLGGAGKIKPAVRVLLGGCGSFCALSCSAMSSAAASDCQHNALPTSADAPSSPAGGWQCSSRSEWANCSHWAETPPLPHG